MVIKTATVIGANGTMGCNISGILASFGNAKVYMVSRSLDKSQQAVKRAIKSVKADAIQNNLVPTDYSQLGKCVRESDLVIESIAENFELKLELNSEIVKYADQNTIISTNTSGLSINKLAEALTADHKKRYLGLHFYNPPYSMTLCEVVPSQYTDRKLVHQVKDYLTTRLYRVVVEIKDSPAFLGNRIGFQFINEALQYAVRFKDSGGIDYIDAILGQFTGRSMAPLVTSDFVGLDVHQAIVDNIFQNTEDYAKGTFIIPRFAVDMVHRGMLGKKSGGGLYKREFSDSGLTRNLVYDLSSKDYRDKIDYNFPFANNMIASLAVGDYERAFNSLIHNHSIEAELCLEFLLKYVVYSLNTARAVGEGVQAADDVMAAGFNWCPPLAVIQALFGKANFSALARERLSKEILDQNDLERLLYDVNGSRYDYRRYFKAKC